ncbi:hypothetical protein IAQ61_008373 [Plenodomus lingam]|nr:hypothetical protein IAQ61_008373 [Plenodomus lingam]
MAEFAFITAGTAPWVHGQGSMTPSRLRSLSPLPAKKEVTRSLSTPHLAKVAHLQSHHESDGMNTLPDPRGRTPTPQLTLTPHDSNESQPDLGQEVSMLSTKLINAINHSTMLDDSLQQTRHELEAAREQLARLEVQVREHEELVSKGLLVEKVVYDKMERQMASELQEERRRRAQAESAKRKTDSEVEALTAALFEEANVMVASARKDTEASDRRGEQLKQQLNDAAILQRSLQEQLQDLKSVVEKMSAHSDDHENSTIPTTAPSTPGLTPSDKMTKLFEAINLTPNTPGTDEISPDHPLHFSHLIHPVLRSDLTAFTEFQDMFKVNAHSSAPNSRAPSGNYGSLSMLGLGSLANHSTTSLPGKSPSIASTNSPRESINAAQGMPNLKDEKFYRRALAEDIEPTLRLDIAPGLSWMARRTVLNSITSGSLVVEPNAPSTSMFRTAAYPCSLCGEARKGEQYARKFRFKTADTEESQRYPLCDWCLGRVRATCDYIGFLRMIAAGHWRAETDEEKKSTWEESVKLREKMFWTRIGGGVVPSFIPLRDSPRSPAFSKSPHKDEERKSEDSMMSFEPRDISVDGPVADRKTRKSEEDPFKSKETGLEKRISIGKTVLSGHGPDGPLTSTQDSATPTHEDATTEAAQAKPALDREEEKRPEQAEAEIHAQVEKSLDVKQIAEKPLLQRQRSASNPAAALAVRKREERLSLKIPGSTSMPGGFE